ncbi:CPBP family intramembrane glutamic endopeptidase [Paenibacillus aceti]|nr:CPBP family intramembrane glutamic endopeptidase [Paenibacillus aceti]
MENKKWMLLLLAGWITLVAGLFLSGLSGDAVGQWFGFSIRSQQLVQGFVMSVLVVPITLYLYQRVYRMAGGKPETPEYSWKRLHHLIIGMFLAIALVSLSVLIACSLGWIDTVKWNPLEQWSAALLFNIVFAFFYEALPEELGLRGMLYDILRHRFSAWLSVLLQTLLFVSFPVAVNLLQMLVGFPPGGPLSIGYIILIFCFGICLQLLRLWTSSLWASIGFHLTYLEMMRFVVSSNQEGKPAIINFHESTPEYFALLSVTMIIIGSILVSLVILGAKHFIRRNQRVGLQDIA